MKKIAILLAAIIAVTSHTVLAYDIKADVSSFTFNVSLQSDTISERPTVMVLNEDKTTVYYAGEGRSEKNDDGTYTLIFDSFSLPQDATTGKYVIRVGGDGTEISETTVDFINNNDRADALNELNDAQDKEQVLAQRAYNLGIDIEILNSLDSSWKKTVIDAISVLDLSNDKSAQQVEEKYKLFYDTYNQALEIAVIAGSEKADAVNDMILNIKYLSIDKEGYYAKLSDKSWVGKVLCEKEFSTDITSEELIKEFDGAVLTGIISQLDYGSGEAAFKEAIKNGLIDVNMVAYNDLDDSKQADVFKNLKKKGITNYEELAAAFKSEVEDAEESGGGGNGGSGSGSGGSGISSGSSIGSVVITQPQDNAGNAQNESVEFSDMQGFDWAAEAVNELSRRGVVSGDGTGRFNPANNVTREEFAKMLVSAFNLYDENSITAFEDVSQDAWYYSYVASAQANGVVSGMSQTQFGIGMSITRQDMAVMLKRVYDMAGVGNAEASSTFTDYNDIADYAKEAVGVLCGAGILNGIDDGSFAPRDSVTRAQSARAIYALLQVIEG